MKDASVERIFGVISARGPISSKQITTVVWGSARRPKSIALALAELERGGRIVRRATGLKIYYEVAPWNVSCAHKATISGRRDGAVVHAVVRGSASAVLDAARLLSTKYAVEMDFDGIKTTLEFLEGTTK